MRLDEFIEQQGRGSLVDLAKKIKAPYPDVSRWAKGLRPVPANRCVAIEKATGGIVGRRDLRDDWREIWPELLESDLHKNLQLQKEEEMTNGAVTRAD